MYRYLSRFLAAGLLAVLSMAASPASAPTATDGWMRALPPGQPTAAAYLRLSNPGPEPVRLVAAESALAGSIEIHESRQVDGMWRMRRLESLTVPPGGQVELAPGGAHLMLFDLTTALREGDELILKLRLDTGASLPVSIKVMPVGASGHHLH
jgi:copper(I)-binding protein